MIQTIESCTLMARVENEDGTGSLVTLHVEFPESELSQYLIERILEQALPEVADHDR